MFANFLYSDEMPENKEEKSLSIHMVPLPFFGDAVAWHIITWLGPVVLEMQGHG